jgi:hypothetical protein
MQSRMTTTLLIVPSSDALEEKLRLTTVKLLSPKPTFSPTEGRTRGTSMARTEPLKAVEAYPERNS